MKLKIISFIIAGSLIIGNLSGCKESHENKTSIGSSLSQSSTSSLKETSDKKLERKSYKTTSPPSNFTSDTSALESIKKEPSPIRDESTSTSHTQDKSIKVIEAAPSVEDDSSEVVENNFSNIGSNNSSLVIEAAAPPEESNNDNDNLNNVENSLAFVSLSVDSTFTESSETIENLYNNLNSDSTKESSVEEPVIEQNDELSEIADFIPQTFGIVKKSCTTGDGYSLDRGTYVKVLQDSDDSQKITISWYDTVTNINASDVELFTIENENDLEKILMKKTAGIIEGK